MASEDLTATLDTLSVSGTGVRGSARPAPHEMLKIRVFSLAACLHCQSGQEE
jgi:hypothetical protein